MYEAFCTSAVNVILGCRVTAKHTNISNLYTADTLQKHYYVESLLTQHLKHFLNSYVHTAPVVQLDMHTLGNHNWVTYQRLFSDSQSA